MSSSEPFFSGPGCGDGMPLRERDLARPVAGHFAALGYRVFAEVGIAGRYADLVAYSSEELVAIELKLEDWKGALRQGMAYQLGTNRAFVAMPLARVQDVWRHRGAFEREGVGLLAIDAAGCVRRVLQAEFQARQFPRMRERLPGRRVPPPKAQLTPPERRRSVGTLRVVR